MNEDEELLEKEEGTNRRQIIISKNKEDWRTSWRIQIKQRWKTERDGEKEQYKKTQSFSIINKLKNALES